MFMAMACSITGPASSISAGVGEHPGELPRVPATARARISVHRR